MQKYDSILNSTEPKHIENIENIQCGNKTLDLSCVHVMGILNVTPDSFSDGGKYVNVHTALEHARQMINDGATIIDIGGESTRPGADSVSSYQELERVMPVVESLIQENIIVSVDTSQPLVIKECIAAGVNIINDVRSLTLGNALELVANSNVAACIMHAQGTPKDMQLNPYYKHVTQEISEFLKNRAEVCVNNGIDRNRLIIDPGFGFGKNLAHNLILLKELQQLHALNLPLLVGMSRKRMIAEVLNIPMHERVCADVALTTMATLKGANIIRVHDVKAAVQAVKMTEAMMYA